MAGEISTQGEGELARFGWDEGWAEHFAAQPQATAARVIRHDGGSVVVATDYGEHRVQLGRAVDPVVVGDWIGIDVNGIDHVAPRRTLLRRAAAGGQGEQLLAANVDLVLVVAGADRPLPAERIDRYLSLIFDSGAEPVMVNTKIDLLEDPSSMVDEIKRRQPGIEVIAFSSKTGEGADVIRRRVSGHTAALVGESGAGKSTITNLLLGEESVEIGEVRDGDARGRHTTTARTVYPLPGGGCLIDNPGIREVALADDQEAASMSLDDIDRLATQCRFSDCRHRGEPGCAVAAAIAGGNLDPERLEIWQRLNEQESLGRRRRR